MIQLPPNFNMDKPYLELVRCPMCKKYQHFTFNKSERTMGCNGCGGHFKYFYQGFVPYEAIPLQFKISKHPKYGPPKYLMVYNHWKEHPEFTPACLWRFYYWDRYSYGTILRYIRRIERDLEGMKGV